MDRIDGIINKKLIIETIADKYLNSNKKELIFVCVGTDKHIGDSLGPIVGTLLKESNKNIIIYGTLEYPYHALSMDDYLQEINEKHSDSFVISIDAALGEEYDIGTFFLREHGVKPGAGLDKKLPTVGDLSIVGIVCSDDGMSFALGKSIRLNFILNLAKQIVAVINGAINIVNDNPIDTKKIV